MRVYEFLLPVMVKSLIVYQMRDGRVEVVKQFYLTQSGVGRPRKFGMCKLNMMVLSS